MTTISNLNIVVQQSGGAKNAQNVRHTIQDPSQLAAAQQREKELQQRTTIQQSEDPKHAELDKDRPDQRRRKPDPRGRQDEESSESSTQASRDSGRLLDTVV